MVRSEVTGAVTGRRPRRVVSGRCQPAIRVRELRAAPTRGHLTHRGRPAHTAGRAAPGVTHCASGGSGAARWNHAALHALAARPARLAEEA